MKKWLIAVLCSALLILPVRAEKTNYSTEPWSNETFPGAIEALDDGTYRYTGVDYMWFAPTARLLTDLRNLLGEDEQMTVEISFRAKVEFKKNAPGKTTLMQPVIRAYPVDGEMALYPELWMKDYQKTIEGREPYFVNSGGNVMYSLPCGELTFCEETWTDISVLMTLTEAHLNPDVFSEWRMTFHNIRDYQQIEAIDVRDLSITLADTQITPEPTEAPTTNEPINTEAPTAADEKTPAPTASETEKNPADNAGCRSAASTGTLLILPVIAWLLLTEKSRKAQKNIS